MKRAYYTILTLIISGSSCTKTSTTSDTVVLDKYMSVSAGSTWNYRLVNNISATTTNYVLASTNRDSTVNGKAYHVFTNSNTGNNEYYFTNGNDYYAFRTLGVLSSVKVEDNYLKDNAPAGTNWSQSYNINVPGLPIAVPVTLTYTIQEKGISRTVNGVTYTDVIHVSGAISSSLVPSSGLVTDIQNYFARKYGFVETNNKVNLNFMGFTQNVDNKTTLVSAVIK